MSRVEPERPEPERAEPERELERELERVADRLRVLATRPTMREATTQAVREVLQRMADLAADAQARPRREVPVLAVHALADQLLVLGHDVLACSDRATTERAHDLVRGLRRTL